MLEKPQLFALSPSVVLSENKTLTASDAVSPAGVSDADNFSTSNNAPLHFKSISMEKPVAVSSETAKFTGPNENTILEKFSEDKKDVQSPPGIVVAPSADGGDDSSKEDDDNDKDSGKSKDGGGKSRRELPAGAVATLKQWLLSPEHFTHPYPTPQDQVLLMEKTGIDKKQLKNWFTNARRRIWKPMLKKQLEQGKLQSTGTGIGVAVQGAIPGLMSSGHLQARQVADIISGAGSQSESVVAHRHYQQALQQHHQQQASFAAVNNLYPNMNFHHPQLQPSITNHPGNLLANNFNGENPNYYMASMTQHFNHQQAQNQQQLRAGVSNISPAVSNKSSAINTIPACSSIGTLPSVTSGSFPAAMKTSDSHAVLMELFARDQDLVRQATESATRKRAAAAAAAAGISSSSAGTTNVSDSSYVVLQQTQSQHPMKITQSAQPSRSGNMPALNSWPHFSSVSSLNNLGALTAVKSITSMSGADLASLGNVNKNGNLALVKSEENMGRADSYAFLELFFDDRSGSTGSIWANRLSGTKRERDEDNDVGLSLDADESPSNVSKPTVSSASFPSSSGALCPAPLPHDAKDKDATNSTNSFDNSTLKRAYDDALAARGLMSVSRSCEKLTDLALPAKMQRTLSQELMKHSQVSMQLGVYYADGGNGQTPGAGAGAGAGDVNQNSSSFQQQPVGILNSSNTQYPVDQYLRYQEKQQIDTSNSQSQQVQPQVSQSSTMPAPLSDPSMANNSVEVPVTTKCALCQCINIDTQLRPCGHMFHGRCLKPSLQNAIGPPTCPIDNIPMQSAVLAVPTEQHEKKPIKQEEQQSEQQVKQNTQQQSQ